MTQLTFLDLCSGIGGFRLGLESAGHKCVGYCEYDKFARASYEAMYDTEGEWKADDVTKLKPSDVPRADIWCFGFPVRIFQSQENSGDWSEKEVEYILTLLTSSKAKKKVISPHTFLLKTLRTCYQLMQDSILPRFCLKWEKQGMTVAGRCLTQKTTEFRKTESACSLSQILEAEVDEKYYLSEEKTKQLLTKL